jgi:hypothetical protein
MSPQHRRTKATTEASTATPGPDRRGAASCSATSSPPLRGRRRCVAAPPVSPRRDWADQPLGQPSSPRQNSPAAPATSVGVSASLSPAASRTAPPPYVRRPLFPGRAGDRNRACSVRSPPR